MKRTISVILAVLITFSVFNLQIIESFASQIDNGMVGETSGTTGNCTWSLDDDGVLTISGNGAMGNYSYDYRYNYKTNAPWWDLRMSIKKVVVTEGVTSIGAYAFYKCIAISAISLPDSLRDIFSGAFGECENLESINLPDSLASIQESAFASCSGLKNITLPTHLYSIGWGAFSCSGLINLVIPNGIKRIDRYAFSGCTSLKSVYISESVTTIEQDAFEECSSLESIQIAKENPVYDSRDNCNAIIISDLNTLLVGSNGTIIPNSVTKLRGYSFAGLQITDITIPSSVTDISASFSDCKELRSITCCSKNLSSFGGFLRCSSLTNVVVPDGVITISNGAFGYCTSLISIAIPDSVTNIEEVAFDGCNNLKDVYYEGTKEQWEEIHVQSYNTPLKKAKIHYNSKIQYLYCNSAVVEGVHVNFCDDWFESDSKDYNHDMARMCSLVDLAGYQKDTGDLKNTLESMGFSVDNSFLDLHTGRDEVNYFIASKVIMQNNEPYQLFFIGCIGSNDAQWNSDFDPWGLNSKTNYDNAADYQKGNNHRGFNDAKNFILTRLDKYLKDHPYDKEYTKFLITGHSRGAAVANLISAGFIDGNNYVLPQNLFTYTFATPNNTTNPSRNSGVYDRIHNIVNPTDFVTKTMPSAWGYGRYGKTYSLPTRTNDKNYKEYKERMLTNYNTINMASFGNTKYHEYTLGEFDVFLVVNTMTAYMRGFENYYNTPYYLNGLTFIKPYDFFQKGLCPFVGGDGNIPEALNILGNSLIGNSGKLYYIISNYFLGQEVIAGLDTLVPSKKLSGRFADAHKIETYCSFMLGLSSDEIEAPRNAFWGSVNCPVDVEIIDKTTGTVVGRIVNNTVDEEIAAKENSIVMTVNGDEKQYWLPSNGDYEVRLTGNDDGIMDYTMKIIDSDLGETERINYFNLEVQNNKTYTSTLINNEYENTEISDFILNNSNGNDIIPNETITKNETVEYAVETNSVGSGLVSNSMTVTSGDYVSVSAEPVGSYFLGWYDGDVLLSQDFQYRFRPKEDVMLTAKFTGLIGDANLDGDININDVTEIQRYLVELEELTEEQLILADANGDDEINIADATHLQMYLAECDIVLGKQPTQ